MHATPGVSKTTKKDGSMINMRCAASGSRISAFLESVLTTAADAQKERHELQKKETIRHPCIIINTLGLAYYFYQVVLVRRDHIL